MSKWLDFSANANRLLPLYISGFLDISGGDLINRNDNVFIENDTSFNGNVFIKSNMGLGVSGSSYAFDISGSSFFEKNLNILGDLSINGIYYQYLDASINSRLFIKNDLSTNDIYIGKKTTVENDISANNRLFASLDVSINGTVVTNEFIANKDVSLNSKLFIEKDSFLSKNLFMSEKFYNINDVCYNKLFIGSDSSFNSDLRIEKDLIVHGRLNVYNNNAYAVISTVTNTYNQLVIREDVSLNGRLYATADISMNSRLFLLSDISINGKLNINGDLSLNGNIYFKDNSIEQSAFVGGLAISNFTNDVTLDNGFYSNRDTVVNANMFISNDTSLNGNLFVNSTTNMQNDVSLNGRLFINKDAEINGTLKTIGDISFNGRLFLGNDFTTGGNITSSKSIILASGADTVFNNRLFIGGDSSLNKALDVSKRSIFTRDVSLNRRVFFGNDVNIGGSLTFTAISFSTDSTYNRLFINGDISGGGNMYVPGKYITHQDVSINGKLFSNTDVSFNSNLNVSSLLNIEKDFNASNRLFLSKDAYFNDSLFVNNILRVNRDASINRLFLTTDASFIGNTYVKNSIILQNDLSINRFFVLGDVSLNGNMSTTTFFPISINKDSTFDNELLVKNQAFFNKSVYAQDISVNGNVNFPSNSIPQSAVNATIYNDSFPNDVSMNSRLYIQNKIITPVVYNKYISNTGFNMLFSAFGGFSAPQRKEYSALSYPISISPDLQCIYFYSWISTNYGVNFYEFPGPQYAGSYNPWQPVYGNNNKYIIDTTGQGWFLVSSGIYNYVTNIGIVGAGQIMQFSATTSYGITFKDANTIYVTTNGGASFFYSGVFFSNILNSGGSYYMPISISTNGQYMIGTGYSNPFILNMSSSYGSNWYTNSANGLISNYYVSFTKLSGNGNYIFLISPNNAKGIVYSSNSGVTWNSNLGNGTLPIPTYNTGISTTYTGQYIYIWSTHMIPGIPNGVSNYTNYTYEYYVSSNYGAYFTKYSTLNISNSPIVDIYSDQTGATPNVLIRFGQEFYLSTSNGIPTYSYNTNLLSNTKLGVNMTNPQSIFDVSSNIVTRFDNINPFNLPDNSTLTSYTRTPFPLDLSNNFGYKFNAVNYFPGYSPNQNSFISMSGNGQYMITNFMNINSSPYGTVISTDYGNTFGPLTFNYTFPGSLTGSTFSSTSPIYNASISYTGQYIWIMWHYNGGVTNTGWSQNDWVFSSSNFGKSFSLSVPATICMTWWPQVSGNGQYVQMPGFLSSDYGNTFKSNYNYMYAQVTKTGITPNAYYQFSYIKISYTGQYMIQTGGTSVSGGYGGISTDFGITWSTPSVIAGYSYMGMSSTGQYMTAYYGGSTYISNNFGTTWTISNTTVPIPTNNLASIHVTEDGRYQLIGIYGSVTTATTAPFSLIWRSTDFGNNWSSTNQLSITSSYINSPTPGIFTGSGVMTCMAMSANGQYTIVGTNGNYGNYGYLSISNVPYFSNTAVFNSINTIGATNFIPISDISINGNLFVNSDVSMNNTWLTVGKNLTVGRNLNVSTLNNYQTTNTVYNNNIAVDNDCSLNSRLLMFGDISGNGELTINKDASMKSRLFIAGDISINGNLFLGSDITIKSTYVTNDDLSLNFRLFINGDVSTNSRLFVNKNAFVNGKPSFYGNLTANSVNLIGDASLSRLFVVNDTTISKKLATQNDFSIQSGDMVIKNEGIMNRLFVNLDLSMNNRVFIANDLSINGTLFANTYNGLIVPVDTTSMKRVLINKDAIINNTLSIAKDVSINGDLFNTGFIQTYGDTYINKRLFASNDSSFNGKVVINATSQFNNDLSMNSRLFIGKDLSLNGNLYIDNDVIINGLLTVQQYAPTAEISTTTTNYKFISNEDLSINYNFFTNDSVHFDGQLYSNNNAKINGVSIGASNNDSTNVTFGTSPLNNTGTNNSAVGYNSLLTNTTGANNSAIGNYAGSTNLTGSQLTFVGNSSSVTTDGINQSTAVGYNTQIDKSNTIVLGTHNESVLTSGNTNLNGRLFVATDSFFNTNMDIVENLTIQGELNLITVNTTNTNQDINFSNRSVDDISLNIVGIRNDAFLYGNMKINNNDISMNNRLFIGGDASFNEDIHIKKESIITQDAYMKNRLFIGNDASFNGNVLVNVLKTSGDLSTDNDLSVFADISMNKNLNIGNNIIMNTDFNADRLFVSMGASINNLTVNNKTIMVKDSSLNSGLFINNATTLNNIVMNENGILNGDASFNSRMFVNEDVSFNSTAFIGRDLLIKGRLNVNSYNEISIINTNTTNYNKFVISNDLSMTGRLYVAGDVSTNRNVYAISDSSFSRRAIITGDISLNGNLHTKNASFASNSIPANAVYVPPANFNIDVSMGSRLFVNKNVNVATNPTVYDYGLDVSGTVNLRSVNVMQLPDGSVLSTALPNLDYLNYAGTKNYSLPFITRDNVLNTTYNTTTNYPTYTSFNTIAMSYSGQYQAIATNSGIYVSNNYGVTWNSSIIPSTQKFTAINISGNGQYMFASFDNNSPSPTVYNATPTSSTYGYTYYSKDYGLSWTLSTTLSNYIYYGGIGGGQYAPNAIFTIRSSYTGQTVLACQTSQIYMSNDYGISWYAWYTWNDTPAVGMSFNGQYVYNGAGMSGWSSNYGKTYVNTTAYVDVFNAWSFGQSNGSYPQSFSSDLRFKLMYTGNNTLHLSTDYGISSTQISNIAPYVAAFSPNNRFITGINNTTAGIYTATIPTINTTMKNPVTMLDYNNSTTGCFINFTSQNISGSQYNWFFGKTNQNNFIIQFATIQANNLQKIGSGIGSGTQLTGDTSVFSGYSGVGLISTSPNAWSIYSDIRLKKNINPIENSLEKIIELNPCTYNWKYQEDTEGKTPGFIAQEFETIFPELTTIYNLEGDTAYMGISIENLIPFIVNAIQEQQFSIHELIEQEALIMNNLKLIESFV
jgi:hypothetical protein